MRLPANLFAVEQSTIPSWSLVDHDGDGDQELLLTHGNGDVVIDGIADFSQLTILTTMTGF